MWRSPSALQKTRGGAAACALPLVAVLACGGTAPVAPASAPPGDEPALHRAAAAGDLKELERLLQPGAAADALGPEEWTPLHRAAQAGQARAAERLLEAGAALEARARYDMRPLHWAAMAGHLDVVALLLAQGAAVDAQNLYGMTALHMAATPEISLRLLAAGAQLEARDVRGMTPLHFAHSHELAKVLLDRGASVSIRDRRGLSPLDMTGVADCTPRGLQVYPEREAARLPEERARLGFLVWNRETSPLVELRLAATSPAADIEVEPVELARFRPAQMTELYLQLSRRQGVAPGKHPLTVTFTAAGREVAACALMVDTRPGKTPEERGLIPVGSVKVREQPAWPQYLGFAAVPLIAVVVWLVWRRRTTS